jgi:hypothetical protein
VPEQTTGYLERQTIRPFVRSYGVISTSTLRPSVSSVCRKLRLFRPVELRLKLEALLRDFNKPSPAAFVPLIFAAAAGAGGFAHSFLCRAYQPCRQSSAKPPQSKKNKKFGANTRGLLNANPFPD